MREQAKEKRVLRLERTHFKYLCRNHNNGNYICCLVTSLLRDQEFLFKSLFLFSLLSFLRFSRVSFHKVAHHSFTLLSFFLRFHCFIKSFRIILIFFLKMMNNRHWVRSQRKSRIERQKVRTKIKSGSKKEKR